jgi:hypothetical protein
MSITLSGMIDPNATGTISNTVTVSPPAGVTDPNLSNNSSTDTDTLTPQADLAIAQTNSAASASYQVAATNPFPSLQFGARIVSTDFNGDGNLDILYQTGNTAGQGIFLALGNCNGTFQAAIAQPSGAAFSTGPLAGIQLSSVVAAQPSLHPTSAEAAISW